MKLGFLGLGRMGYPMARLLLRAGHTVAVWNRTGAKAESLHKSDGARVASSPADAAFGAEVVLSMLADDDAVRSTVLGEGKMPVPEPLVSGMPPGAIHVSMSTISPALSKELAEAHASNAQRYLAAPVLGRPEAAQDGKLVLLVGGPDDAATACAHVFQVLGHSVHRLGFHPERANAAKLACNFVLASIIEVLGEAFALGERYGVGAPALLGILQDSMLRPETLAAYGKRIAEARFEPAGFKLKLGLKDMDLLLGAAEAQALPMPTASVLHDRFLVALAQGLEDKDWSAIARTLPHKRAA
ncbi:MAG TPA: NAD(P)-dependent oxidoreductase [Polyangiaceae bacterium]|nr:NAD(P)-dependent oxidoreductase [Polyangiaceae bacterium]